MCVVTQADINDVVPENESEALLQKPIVQAETKVHTMPDGTTMLDTDMADWEMKHSPGMHMMQDGSWMEDEEMVHTMSDGTVMRDVDMPAMAGQGLLAVSEDLHGKHQAESAHTHSAPRLLSKDLLLEYRKLRSQYHDAVKAGVHGDLRHALSAQYHLLESKVRQFTDKQKSAKEKAAQKKPASKKKNVKKNAAKKKAAKKETAKKKNVKKKAA